MRILVIAPRHRPQVQEIADTLEAMRQVVEGKIEVIYPSEGVALITNSDGKSLHLPPNRELRDEDGSIYDIAHGTFFLCGAPANGEDFVSLTDEQMQQYSTVFAMPRLFIKLNNQLVILPYDEQACDS